MLGIKLPSVGVFDVRSGDRVVQGTVVRRLLAFVRGTDGITFRGRRILLNSNPRWLTHPVYGGIVSELAAALHRRGATVLRAGIPGNGEGSSDGVLSGSGLAGEAPEPVRQTVPFDCRKSTRVRLGRQTFRLPKPVFEVDLVVNIAGLFVEPRAGLAGAMYNVLKLLCGNRRGGSVWSLDPTSFNTTMVDIVSRIIPDLNILVVPGVAKEPASGIGSVAQILVSTDVVAIDTLAASLVGYDPREIPAISLAAESGLGIGWIEAIRLTGDRPRSWAPTVSTRSEDTWLEQERGLFFGDHSDVPAVSDYRHASGKRPVRVTYCPGADSSHTLATVAVCVGEVKCDTCRRCVGVCPALLN